jgi:hypothetical protein
MEKQEASIDDVALHLSRSVIPEEGVEPIDFSQRSWMCCNHSMDNNAVRFFSVLGISTLGISVCISKLFSEDDCGNRSTYITIMTGIISYWMPSPKF